jgi:hypothetical protein
MTQAKNIFFGFIALSMAVAAAFQFLIVFEINDKCDDADVDVTAPPTIAGACLSASFLANGAWLMARRRKGGETCARVALLVWSTLVLVGVVAAGATLGQIPLYPTACPSLIFKINFETIQYISIALLVFSTVAPHGIKSKKKASLTASAAAPITMSGYDTASGGIVETTPLTFF